MLVDSGQAIQHIRNMKYEIKTVRIYGPTQIKFRDRQRDRELTMKNSETRHKDFTDSVVGLTKWLKQIDEIPEAEKVTATGINIGYKDGELTSVTIEGEKWIEQYMCHVSIRTPKLKVNEYPELPKEVLPFIWTAVNEAELYIDGKSAQEKLNFEGEPTHDDTQAPTGAIDRKKVIGIEQSHP